ncbi:MAG: hypothetical protein QW559_02690 [Candidatus Woesearchaeota archaeon]
MANKYIKRKHRLHWSPEHAESLKPRTIKLADEFVFIYSWLVSILEGFAASFILLPVFLITSRLEAYLFSVLTGFAAASLILAFLKGLAHIKKVRHEVLLLFGAPISFAAVYFSSRIANFVFEQLLQRALISSAKSEANPLIAAAGYTIGFLAPLIYQALLKRKEQNV